MSCSLFVVLPFSVYPQESFSCFSSHHERTAGSKNVQRRRSPLNAWWRHKWRRRLLPGVCPLVFSNILLSRCFGMIILFCSCAWFLLWIRQHSNETSLFDQNCWTYNLKYQAIQRNVSQPVTHDYMTEALGIHSHPADLSSIFAVVLVLLAITRERICALFLTWRFELNAYLTGISNYVSISAHLRPSSYIALRLYICVEENSTQ